MLGKAFDLLAPDSHVIAAIIEARGDLRAALSGVREARGTLKLMAKLTYFLAGDGTGKDRRMQTGIFVGDDRDPKTILLERFTRIIERREVGAGYSDLYGTSPP